MDIRHIFLFLGVSFLFGLHCKNSTIGMMEEVGVFPLCHPKRYIVTPNWVRKVFKIKHRFIPRYFYFRLILSLFYATLGPVNLIVLMVAGADLGGILLMCNVCLYLIDVIVFIIISSIMKKK